MSHIESVKDLDARIKGVGEVEGAVVVLERCVAHVVIDWGVSGGGGGKEGAREKRCMGLPVVGWAYGPSAASLGARVVNTRRGVMSPYGFGRLRKPDGAREAGGAELAMFE